MSTPPGHKAIIKQYEASADEVKRYFEHLPKLVKDFPFEVALSYLFARVERAHNMTLYCGVVKLHRAESAMAASIIKKQHLTRDLFKELFNSIYGVSIETYIAAKLTEAEKIRDRAIHGKEPRDKEMRKAISDVLIYAEQFNDFVEKAAQLKPFGDLRGFKGRGKPLEKSTTRWLLKGLGFAVK
jgi:hypothetical protein